MTFRGLVLLSVLWITTTCGAQVPLKVDYAMDSDPLLVEPGIERVISKVYLKLWLELLAQPEQDLLHRTAEAIERAHGLGMPGLNETIGPLTSVLTAKDSLPSVRFAAARALITIKAKDSAAMLLEAAQQTGLDLRQIVEPALAEWDFEPARAMWLARLTDRQVRHRDLMLAVRCLGQVREIKAQATLREVVLDSLRPADLRLEAAQTLGQLATEGFETDAAQLARDSQQTPAAITHRVCAVRLMSRHASATARSWLVAMSKDSEPAVAAVAMNRLIEIDPDLMLPMAEAAMQSADAKIRRAGFAACVLRPTPERMPWTVKLLDDVNPALRGDVREALFQLAKTPELDAVIRPAAMLQLAADSWRGQEQAALLLASLDHKAATSRLVELLKSSRPEVMVVSAWGLRKLAVPETLAPMLEHAHDQTRRRQAGDVPNALDPQVALIFETFGMMKYRAADSLLRQYIGKRVEMGEYSRGAAIWSLGKFNEGRLDAGLAQLLITRLTDMTPMPSEMPRVRQASAIALGWMNAKSHAPAIRDFMGPGPQWSGPQLAMRWAVIKLTGDPLPEPAKQQHGFGFSFAEPIPPRVAP